MKSMDEVRRYTRVTESGCWEWLGARVRGQPKIMAPDFTKAGGAMTTQTGRRAVWHIVHGAALPDGWRVYADRTKCTSLTCVNPDHLAAGAPKSWGQNRTEAAQARDVGVRLLERIRERCTDDAGCWIWGGYAVDGVMPIMKIAGRGPSAVRRLAWEAKVGPVRPGYEVVRTCDQRLCCNPDHLKVVTKADRRRELGSQSNLMTAARLNANRERQGKLSMEKAREIRLSDEPGPVLAERYGVSRTLISFVRRGISWAEPSPFAGLGARP